MGSSFGQEPHEETRVEQQSLEQQAKTWLDNREQALRSSRELQAQGWWISDKLSAVNPDSLQEPLRSEVLRQMSQPSH